MYNCICCNKYIHKIKNIEKDGDLLKLEVTNDNNIGNLDCFQLIVNRNIDCDDLEKPLALYVSVNGIKAILRNKYSLPIYSDKLPCRKKYYGYYVEEGCNHYIIFQNTPYCKCNA